MNFQKAITEMTWEAVEMLLRYAKAVPEEKLSWRPAEQARSVLEILQECALLPSLLADLLEERPQEKVENARWESLWAQARELTTVEACERVLRENTERLLAVIQAIPDADFQQQVMTPWGRKFPVYELMYDHYWNLTYHLGQVAYIQLLYGDTKMH